MNRRNLENCITHSELKKSLFYNPDAGVFTWLISDSNMVKVGDIAGYKSPRGYIVIAIKGKGYKAHRVAWFYMTGEWPVEIDHVNHIKDDNRWRNLRSVRRRDNGKNQPKSIRNTSGIVGVYRDKASGKWEARITVNNKQIYLNRFDDMFLAICARKSAEKRYGFHENHGR